ncbi:MAG: VOC family protein [Sedimentitalea sp.]
MIKVLGIGGFFFRAKDPGALAVWYETQFGISKVPTSYEEPVWQQQEGATVFAPFEAETSYFGRPEQGWMINFRVADLAAAVAELTGQGIDVEVDPQVYPNGRFARLADPEGNPVQLWQPSDSAV